MAKIQPNDPCPCGSGKKYKYCCGSNNKIIAENFYSDDFIREHKSNLFLDDFVIDNLNEDCVYLVDEMQRFLGPDGYKTIFENKDWYNNEYRKDYFKSGFRQASETYERKGIIEIRKRHEDIGKEDRKRGPLTIRPYGGTIPDEQKDIISLLNEGRICREGRQVELFHASLMENLIQSFDRYLYIPSDEMAKKQTFGAFAHRGYDFLLGITLYLELQLGVHMYFEKENTEGLYFGKNVFEEKNFTNNTNNTEILKCAVYRLEYLNKHKGLKVLLNDYMSVVEEISSKYNAEAEVELYHKIGAYHSEEEYRSRKELLKLASGRISNPFEYLSKFVSSGIDKPFSFDYLNYLRFMILGISYNDADNAYAAYFFPQCDMEKYLFGLENLCALFGDYEQDGKSGSEQYQDAVFNFTDELNGFSAPVRYIGKNRIAYKDDPDINEDEYGRDADPFRKNNPARKSTSPFPVRKPRMRIFNVLNGKSFTLRYGKTGEEEKEWKTIGKYPILPWISNDGMKMFHTKPFDGKAKNLEDLCSEDVSVRQDFLNMEFRIAAKPPVNRMEEYLDPEVYYDWLHAKELKKIKTEQESLRLESARLRDELLLKDMEWGEKIELREEEWKQRTELREEEWKNLNDELVQKYEDKAKEVEKKALQSAVGTNYSHIKENVKNDLLRYEQEVMNLLGISGSLLQKTDRSGGNRGEIITSQLYTSELTFRLLTDSVEDNEPVDITISILPLTKSIELVLKELYNQISVNELEDFANSKFLNPGKDRKLYFDYDRSSNTFSKKSTIELWALIQLFNDQKININWEQWWNRNGSYVDLDILKKFAGAVTLPQLEDGNLTCSVPATFQTSKEANRKILFNALNFIRDRYRNPIAHSTLQPQDYHDCRDYLISGQKLLWILLAIMK